MKKREKLDYSEFEYPSDVERICNVLTKYGYITNPQEANDMWEEWSSMNAAGWMGLPERDNELIRILESMM